MKGPVFAYLASGLVFLVMDATWLTTMVPKLYKPRLGALIADKPSLPPAVAFYLIYLLGILLLAILPAAREDSWRRLVFNAAVFGFCAYATYDLTNQATLRSWSTTLTVVDIAWGTLLTTAAACAGYAALRAVK
ncbi:DUF2177 family protein [Caulobacter sp. RHG1]|uniref:DUF2177 family protein n=1 Tax=Caulobacter sp. (strain RHG1) TaxID=2545762 RepID=UPI001555EFFB|nr:DUF2177 family protein [Caulobacter sp. RHG1]NQE60894.1 hypothetical protein [Caulobacter sp. RHG1]